MATVYLDEIKPGMSAISAHTVTEHQIQLFGEATGDMNPVHFDEEYARKTVFRGRVAHGVLSMLDLFAAWVGEAAHLIAWARATSRGPVRAVYGSSVTSASPASTAWRSARCSAQ